MVDQCQGSNLQHKEAKQICLFLKVSQWASLLTIRTPHKYWLQHKLHSYKHRIHSNICLTRQLWCKPNNKIKLQSNKKGRPNWLQPSSNSSSSSSSPWPKAIPRWQTWCSFKPNNRLACKRCSHKPRLQSKRRGRKRDMTVQVLPVIQICEPLFHLDEYWACM